MSITARSIGLPNAKDVRLELSLSAHGPDNLGDRGSSRMRLCLIRLALKAPNIALLQDAKVLLDKLA